MRWNLLNNLLVLGRYLFNSFKDLAPIVFVVLLFQFVVLQQPLPNTLDMIVGLLFVVIGLTLFIFGLETGLFPIGETLARSFAAKGSLFWLVVFAFLLGFGTTIAEPALIAVAAEAAQIASDSGVITATEESQDSYAMGLRITVALSVGLAIVLGVIRIIAGWSLQWIIIIGYIGVLLMTLFAPQEIIGIAYDSGGVTTSTITVPLVTALGVGLASSIKGRNPMIDGFGLIALASLTPMIFVMAYGMIIS